MTYPVVRERITDLEKAIQAVPVEQQVTFENLHLFCPGIYARSIFMPAGTVLTSKIHKTQHFFVVSKGACTVSRSSFPSMRLTYGLASTFP